MTEPAKSQRLIVCCDGTGNEIKENQSNVLKFYRCLKKNRDDQISFYDTGVGTISDSSAWSVFKSRAKGVFGLATGYGMDANILDAYRFLIDHHREGDEIYLFGFSRGAYTVRVLAGLINLVGIPFSNQRHLAEYALTAYKQASTSKDFSIAWRVQEVLETKRATVRFMGCWDTVGSVIIPRPDRFYLPSLQQLPYTSENPCVQVFRHAISIDERRRMFRLSRWTKDQLYKSNPFVPDDKAERQDCKEFWFAGVHSDIGGGYAERDSGAAKYPLAWMVDEARTHGLVFRERLVDRLVHGRNPSNVVEGSARDYAEPSPTAKLHNSMNWAWRILEFIPKRKKYHDDPDVQKRMGFYFPLAERRYVPADAELHQSVRDRKAASDYLPVNLKASGHFAA